MCELQLLKWPTVDALSWALVALSTAVFFITRQERVEFFLASRYFGTAVGALRRLNSGSHIESDPELTDIIQLLDRYHYFDQRLDRDKSEIAGFHKSALSSRIYVSYEDGETEDFHKYSENMFEFLFRNISGKVDNTLSKIEHVGFVVFLFGVICKLLYFGRSYVEAIVSSLPC